MPVVLINQHEVRQLLPMNECIELMEETLLALGRDQAILPLRKVMWLPDKRGALAMMPSYLGNMDALGLKVITVFPGNGGTEFDSHQGVVHLFDPRNGQLLAIVDATAVTEIRTAAVSGVATRLLAQPDAGDLAILGSGTQARSHLEAMLTVRNIHRVRVWSRSRQNAERFARLAGDRHGIVVEAVPSAQGAVVGANIICTATSSEEPVLAGEWISPGAHINAIGASGPFARELDTTTLLRSSFFVDRRESTIQEAGDFIIPMKEGDIDEAHIRAELSEVLMGMHQGRRAEDEITLFKSLGLAVEDLAAAFHIYQKALDADIGTRVDLGGTRHGLE